MTEVISEVQPVGAHDLERMARAVSADRIDGGRTARGRGHERPERALRRCADRGVLEAVAQRERVAAGARPRAATARGRCAGRARGATACRCAASCAGSARSAAQCCAGAAARAEQCARAAARTADRRATRATRRAARTR